MVPWWWIPITAWASAGISLFAYALVKVGADPERTLMSAEEPVEEGGEAMSMLGSQCERLRDRADELRMLASGMDAPYIVPSTKETMALAMQSAASEMREAADTIISLRNRLQELQGVTSESRYSELFGTPEKAARTLSKTFSQCDKHGWHCNSCDFYLAPACPNVVGSPVDYDALLEWLRGDAE